MSAGQGAVAVLSG